MLHGMLLSTILLGLLPLAAQEPPAPPSVAATWPDVRKVLARDVPLGTAPDPGAGAALRVFQGAAVRWVEARLAQGATWESLPEGFQAQLPPKACEGLGAEPPSLHLLPLTSSPAWRLLRLDCPVPCGTTEAVLVFERVGERWHLRLADLWSDLEAKDVGSARENVSAVFRLTPHGPRLVVADTPPWCTSCWSSLRVRVLAPGPAPESPRVIQTRESSDYRCDEPPFRMALRQHSVVIRFNAMGTHPDILKRPRRWTLSLH